MWHDEDLEPPCAGCRPFRTAGLCCGIFHVAVSARDRLARSDRRPIYFDIFAECAFAMHVVMNE